jgi:hypothetical protein
MNVMTRTLPPPSPDAVAKVLWQAIERSNVRFMVTPKLEEPTREPRRRKRPARGAA